jgi:hypothetical protein
MAGLKAFVEELSPGEIIIIILTGIPLIITLYTWIRNRRFPFSMRYIANGKYLRKLSIPRGQDIIKLRLKARIAVELTLIDIRFVTRRYIKQPRDVSPEVIRIAKCDKFEWEVPGPAHNDLPSEVGNYRTRLDPPVKWTVGDYLYVDLLVEANKPWRGHLSFEGKDDRRLYVRRPFSVMRKRTSGS